MKGTETTRIAVLAGFCRRHGGVPLVKGTETRVDVGQRAAGAHRHGGVPLVKGTETPISESSPSTRPCATEVSPS